MAELKPAYLIHGDDHGAVAERRAGLRALVEAREGGAASIELLEGAAATPAGLAEALSMMTLGFDGGGPGGPGRVILVEGVERWRQADVEKALAPALSAIAPATTVALFAREEDRAKAPAALHEAVKRAGGQIVSQMNVKPWELPAWVRERAARMGLSLDNAAGRALVRQVGERQQRLLRELEKLALEVDTAGGETSVGSEEIELRAAHSFQWRAFSLADALLGGDRREATLCYLHLREQGERLSGLSYLMAQRLRDALAVALRLGEGASVADVKRGLRMPSRAAERFVSDVARTDPDRLRHALQTLADLELDSRGGAVTGRGSTGLAALDEDTLALRAIGLITSVTPV